MGKENEDIEDETVNEVEPDEIEEVGEVEIEDGLSEDNLDENSQLIKENADLVDKLQRSLAEFDNFRKRTIKEKSQMYDDAVKDTIEKLLPLVDNFERAVNSFESKDDNIYKGFEMILKQMYNYLEEIGVKKIEAIGQQFDTKYHFAVAHVEDDNYPENEVIEELQKGYIYKEKVVRCAMVKVAK